MKKLLLVGALLSFPHVSHAMLRRVVRKLTPMCTRELIRFSCLPSHAAFSTAPTRPFSSEESFHIQNGIAKLDLKERVDAIENWIKKKERDEEEKQKMKDEWELKQSLPEFREQLIKDATSSKNTEQSQS